VDEIVAKNAKARGGMDKLKAIQTVRAACVISMGAGMEAPAVIMQKRPDLMRMEFTLQGLTAIQAYDGQNAWQVMPFMGKKDPEVMSGDDKKNLQDDADIEGSIINYQAKGNKVELQGKEKVEGTDTYKLKVTLKSGDVRTLYLDGESFLEIKSEEKRTMRGTEQEIESSIGDYKDVSGVLFPFVIESGMKGAAQKQKITCSKFEVNAPLDDALFKMPPPAPPPPVEPASKSEAPKN
jgi:outer membrane lipoprotein-sorting protein